jgi:DNA-binding NarL/FixJ family response regulator
MPNRNVYIVSRYPLVRSWLCERVLACGWKVTEKEPTNGESAIHLLEIADAKDESPLRRSIARGHAIILFTRHQPLKLIRFLYEYEINGLFHLEAGENSLHEMLKAADDDDEYFDETVLPFLLSDKYRDIYERIASLSPREFDIIDGIMEELTNQEIAERYGLSIRTVNAHKRNILQKTHSNGMVGLTRLMLHFTLRYS